MTESEEERSAIMQFDGHIPRKYADEWAVTRPWEISDSYWEMIAAAMDIFNVKETK
jgi:hypothetical protein